MAFLLVKRCHSPQLPPPPKKAKRETDSLLPVIEKQDSPMEIFFFCFHLIIWVRWCGFEQKKSGLRAGNHPNCLVLAQYVYTAQVRGEVRVGVCVCGGVCCVVC